MIAMVEVSRDVALCIWTCAAVELYELFDDGTESLIEDEEHMLASNRFGIEGELFGKPYESGA